MALRRIEEKDLSEKSKEFIRKFKRIRREKYEELVKKLAMRPVTVDQVEYIMR